MFRPAPGMGVWALAALVFIGITVTVQAQAPQVCNNGVQQLDNGQYEEAIRSLTECLERGSGGNPAKAYYNRGAALFLHWYYDIDSMDDDLLEDAYDDLTRAIELNPDYGLAYCILGNVLFNQSFGMFGEDEIDRGRELGVSEDKCYLWE